MDDRRFSGSEEDPEKICNQIATGAYYVTARCQSKYKAFNYRYNIKPSELSKFILENTTNGCCHRVECCPTNCTRVAGALNLYPIEAEEQPETLRVALGFHSIDSIGCEMLEICCFECENE